MKYGPKIVKTMNKSNISSADMTPSPIFRVGLTGGIGSGKSAVATILEKLGAKIIDFDLISHQITQAGGLAIPEIQKVFGQDFISNGALDRHKMRNEILNNPSAKVKLEAITHPVIHQIADQLSQKIRSEPNTPYLVYVVPLLLESGKWLNQTPAKIDLLAIVDCPEDLQISRVQQRSGLDRASILKIMSHQANRQDRLSQADFVITNDQDLEYLEKQCLTLHQQILQKTHQKQ